MSLERYLIPQVLRDLEKKMVFVSGPRQVGKTTLALQVAGGRQGYLNWDVPEHRSRILAREFPPADLWILDEIHKHRRWRQLLKGLYDARPEQKILVTGSARLDLLRQAGESLQGRYHHLRLHPLSMAELGEADSLEPLLQLGGFPEPFLSGSQVEARRWSLEYRRRLVRDEVVSLERVVELDTMEVLLLRLPELVGSPLSVNALREDLQVSHQTVASWLTIFERLYAIFTLPPFGAPRLRAIKKARKHYHLDWTVVGDAAARFENLVACALLKWVHHQIDTQGRDLELRYFRDSDGREVDFVITEQGQPILLVEAKLAEAKVDRSLRYLKRRFPDAAAWQLSAEGSKDALTPEGIRLAPAHRLLLDLV